MVQEGILLVLEAQVGDFIGHGDVRTHDGDADGPLQLQIIAKEGSLPDGALNDDSVLFLINRHRLRGQAMAAAMLGLIFPFIPVGTAGGPKTAGIQQAAGEGIQKFQLIGIDGRGTVVAVLADEGHIGALIADLADIQAGIRQDIHLEAPGGAYFNDCHTLGLALGHGHSANGVNLLGMANIAVFL